jgi:hypothetical protein
MKKTKKKDLIRFSFLENPAYQFDIADMSNVINLQFHGATFLKTSVDFHYVYEQHAHACLCDLKALFAFQLTEEQFSFVSDFDTKFKLKLQQKDSSNHPADGGVICAAEFTETPISDVAGRSPIIEGIKLAQEMSPQAKKYLASKKSTSMLPLQAAEEAAAAHPPRYGPQETCTNTSNFCSRGSICYGCCQRTTSGSYLELETSPLESL